ncbi:MAG: aldehyde ferredoxin oxidoreductase family protein [Ardenticatenaceae bacterium]|nr:aldehyde ferredoxin oxidoreductase family protein [Ardenticatenaceae bacterium]MCB8991158.1 aldehyde ferredoxin oxidoreductase family protein [Ardenticatenaceae bacterium]
MQGWAGKILDIDLSSGSIQTVPLDMEMARLFLGGRGLGARLLWDLVGPEVEPLSPENVLIFTTGPITASASQTSNRFNVSSKSPLTGTILHANSGGWWGMQFKRTGYDVLIVRGKAETPVMIEITPEGTAVKDASHLWGKTVFETTEALGQSRNKRNVLCIGPAGENLVRIAAIMNDKERSLARGGPGAVMGSKNLKAIVVEGKEKNEPEDKEQFKFLSYETGKLLKASPLTSQALPEFGTAVVMNVVNEIGALPTRNFQQSQFEGADDISGEAITDNILVKKQACWACPIACTRITKTTSGKEGEGPEFESSWAFGAQCGIDDLEVITEANYLCNDLGLDTISMGNTVGCAMELAEKGLVDADLGFGRADRLHDLIRDTAYRRGLGDEMAEGSYRLAAKYGAPELSMTVKKLELPAYDPRGMQGQGLVYATSNRGACHETGNMLGPEVLALPRLLDRFATQGKAGIVSVHQHSAAVIDSLVYCKFANMAVAEEFFARVLTAVTGIPYTADDLMIVGERVWTLERLYNLREGFTQADDTLPDRLLNEPVSDGPSKGHTARLAPMLEEYYAFRGWDKNGVPKPEKLRELGLDNLK